MSKLNHVNHVLSIIDSHTLFMSPTVQPPRTKYKAINEVGSKVVISSPILSKAENKLETPRSALLLDQAANITHRNKTISLFPYFLYLRENLALKSLLNDINTFFSHGACVLGVNHVMLQTLARKLQGQAGLLEQTGTLLSPGPPCIFDRCSATVHFLEFQYAVLTKHSVTWREKRGSCFRSWQSSTDTVLQRQQFRSPRISPLAGKQLHNRRDKTKRKTFKKIMNDRIGNEFHK